MPANKEEADYKKTQSRKWRLALLLVMLATFGAFLPPIVSLWILKSTSPLVILSGTEWVSVVTMVVGLYIGGNVYQKHIERKSLSSGVSFNASVNAVGDAAVPPERPSRHRGYGGMPHSGMPYGGDDPAEFFYDDDSDEGREA